MSSAYALARTYNQFIPPVNLELMAQSMALKQQRYDQGYSMIESSLDFMKNIDIVKSEDMQYFQERVSKLTNDINSLEGQGLDLSARGTQKALKNYLGQAIDNNVINAITSTKKYRAFQNEVSKIQEKDPDKYSVVNEMYARRPFNEYLYDGKVGSKLDNLMYSPKVDVNAKMTKIVKEAFEKYGERESYNISADNWSKEITKLAGIEGEKIRNFVDANMTAEDRQQLAIDGWYNMGMAEGEQAKKILTDHIKINKSEYRGTIAIAKEKLKKGGLTTEEIEKAENDIKYFEKVIENIDELPKNLKSPEQIGAYFEKEKLIGGLQDMYGMFQKSKEITTNDVYADQLKYNLDLGRFRLEERKYEDERNNRLNPNTNNFIYTSSVDNETPLEDIYGEGIAKIVEAENAVISEIGKDFENSLKDSADKDNIVFRLKREAERTKTPLEDLQLEYLKNKSGNSEEERQRIAQLELRREKTKNSYAKTQKELESIVESDFKDYSKVLNGAQSYIGLMSEYKRMYDKAQPKEKIAIEQLYKVAQQKYKDIEADKNNVLDVNAVWNFKNLPISKAVKTESYKLGTSDYYKNLTQNQKEDNLKRVSEINKELQKYNRIPLIGGFTDPYTDEEQLKINQLNEELSFLMGNSGIKYQGNVGEASRKARLEDITRSLAEEYAPKNIKLNQTSNPMEYEVVRTFFSQGEIGEAFRDKEDIVLKRTSGDKYMAYQKYRDKDGKTQTIKSPEFDLNKIIQTNPQIARNIDFGLKEKTEFIPMKKNLSWNFNDPRNPEFNKESVIKEIDNLDLGDNISKDKLKDLVTNASKYSVEFKKNERTGVPQIALYKGDVLVHELPKVFNEQNAPIAQEDYLTYPEKFIQAIISDVIDIYQVNNIAPTYFKK